MTKTNSSIVVGSSSEIGGWIKQALLCLGLDCIMVGRNPTLSDFVVDSYNNLETLIYTFETIYSANNQPTTLYFCPGTYTNCGLSESDPQAWNQDILINLNSAYIFYKAITHILATRKTPTKLIFIGSTASISKPINYSSYAIAKTALETLVTYINNEKPEWIRALCLRLGTCKTEFSNSSTKENTINKDDMRECVSFIEMSRQEMLPDLISIRPLRYLP